MPSLSDIANAVAARRLLEAEDVAARQVANTTLVTVQQAALKQWHEELRPAISETFGAIETKLGGKPHCQFEATGGSHTQILPNSSTMGVMRSNTFRYWLDNKIRANFRFELVGTNSADGAVVRLYVDDRRVSEMTCDARLNASVVGSWTKRMVGQIEGVS